MRQKSDAQLIRITTELKDDYQPDAVAAAQKESESRNLSADQIEQAELILNEKNRIDKELAERPLAPIWKILTFVKPGIIQLFIAVRMKGEGKVRMADELSKYTLRGFGFYFGLLALIMILSRMLWSYMAQQKLKRISNLNPTQ